MSVVTVPRDSQLGLHRIENPQKKEGRFAKTPVLVDLARFRATHCVAAKEFDIIEYGIG